MCQVFITPWEHEAWVQGLGRAEQGALALGHLLKVTPDIVPSWGWAGFRPRAVLSQSRAQLGMWEPTPRGQGDDEGHSLTEHLPRPGAVQGLSHLCTASCGGR